MTVILLSRAHLAILRVLQEADGVLATTIAKRLGVVPNGVGVSLAYMAKLGLAVCDTAAGNPTRRWAITDAGRAAIADPGCHAPPERPPLGQVAEAAPDASGRIVRQYKPRFDGGFSSSGDAPRRPISLPAAPWEVQK